MKRERGSTKSRTSTALTSVIVLALVYVALAFAFSLAGFVAQKPAIHLHEYSFPEAVEEVGGHFLFGAIAAAPFLSVWKSLLSGAFAICIDADHILGALNLNVSSRPDHSIAFALFATLAVWVIAAKLDRDRSVGTPFGVAVLVPISILSHISYDVFAAYQVFNSVGFSFPIFAPLSFSLIAFPFWAFVPFEAAAIGSSAFLARRLGNRQQKRSE